jgi:hypothetical protein
LQFCQAFKEEAMRDRSRLNFRNFGTEFVLKAVLASSPGTVESLPRRAEKRSAFRRFPSRRNAPHDSRPPNNKSGCAGENELGPGFRRDDAPREAEKRSAFRRSSLRHKAPHYSKAVE